MREFSRGVPVFLMKKMLTEINLLVEKILNQFCINLISKFYLQVSLLKINQPLVELDYH